MPVTSVPKGKIQPRDKPGLYFTYLSGNDNVLIILDNKDCARYQEQKNSDSFSVFI